MGETSEGRKRIGIENLSLENFPRDLLQRFMSSSATSTSAREEEEEDSEELELNLGLSLGGRFGIDKSKKIKLVRSSSIIGTVPFIRSASIAGDDSASPAPALMRTASLPVETEEEWKKRKEIQMLRRMAAKRRRSEKQRIGKFPEKEDDSSPSTISGQNSIVGGGVDLEAAVTTAAKGRKGSAESIGGSSSGMSELESRVGCPGSRSPVGGSQSQPSGERSREGGRGENNNNKCSTSGPGLDLGRNPSPSGNKGREIGTSAVEEMPSVFAKGDGPNGRRVDGILYRYGKGAEIRIMCVCHGKFLSPADFVKHAGGGDVENPLRHIVINPSPASLL